MVQKVKTWFRSVVPDPDVRIYLTHLFLVLAVLCLKDEGITPTKSEISRLTTLSYSSISHGLEILEEHGILESDGNAYSFAVEVPQDIREMSIHDDDINHADIEAINNTVIELKKFVVAQLSDLDISQEQVQTFESNLEDFEPEKKDFENETGTKRLLGDAVM